MKIRPILLSGGAGTRLWPLSRAHYPKQLLPLLSERSLLQETALRVAPEHGFAAPLVICNDQHRFVVAEQLRAVGCRPEAILLEPIGRNTAPAAAAAAVVAAASDPDALVLLLPSDHFIEKPEAFRAAIAAATPAAQQGYFAIFGVTPTQPETGYGYIRQGAALRDFPALSAVAQFIEKPDAPTAKRLLAEGCLWNGGMVLFSARAYLSELRGFEPEIVDAARDAVAAAKQDLDFLRLDRAAFTRAPAKSIDYALLEHTQRAALIPVSMGWTDVGSWNGLWQTQAKDAAGNVVAGDAVTNETYDSYIRAEHRLVAVQGVRDLVVIETADAVLVMARDQAAKLGATVAKLGADHRDVTESHRRVLRPWGSYEPVDSGAGFQVKRLIVNPGCRLSLQRHRRRAEHWVVVRGTARVTCDGKSFDLEANQSTYIPVGSLHRLENPTDQPLHLIEVQSGDYLGEDDIERLEDQYGRAAPQK